ncbi:MAG: Holliday junction ATP-dependent DNA helicase RuvA [Elusimicrobia bacterium]|nr:Holliday junction ATP-dependent DNA helicase RuvA [Elusimicrobiota bacterium]
MIAQLRGKVVDTHLEKDVFRVVLDVNGVGYEILMAPCTEGKLGEGQAVTVYIVESVTAFDGATTLYGFATLEEKEFFTRIRQNVDGMGPKKALECLDKISKSKPDFKRAIIDGDLRLLVSVFGFTKKTAEKLVFALKGKVDHWAVSGPVKWAEAATQPKELEALSGLLNLGYDEAEARELVQKAKEQAGADASPEILIKQALQLLGGKIS